MIKIMALIKFTVLTGIPIIGSPTFRREKVKEPSTAQETRDFIPPDNGMPPRISATMTFISKPVPVESDAEPVYHTRFTDLSDTAWYYPYAARLERGELFQDLVLGPEGTLDPQTPESRGNVAQLLYNLWLRQGGSVFAYPGTLFEDVPAADTRSAAIAWARGCGIIIL